MSIQKTSDTHIPEVTLDAVEKKGQRIRIARKGHDPVYLVSARDLKMLRALEDRYWKESGLEELKRFEESGEKAIPWKKERTASKR